MFNPPPASNATICLCGQSLIKSLTKSLTGGLRIGAGGWMSVYG